MIFFIFISNLFCITYAISSLLSVRLIPRYLNLRITSYLLFPNLSLICFSFLDCVSFFFSFRLSIDKQSSAFSKASIPSFLLCMDPPIIFISYHQESRFILLNFRCLCFPHCVIHYQIKIIGVSPSPCFRSYCFKEIAYL